MCPIDKFSNSLLGTLLGHCMTDPKPYKNI